MASSAPDACCYKKVLENSLLGFWLLGKEAQRKKSAGTDRFGRFDNSEAEMLKV